MMAYSVWRVFMKKYTIAKRNTNKALPAATEEEHADENATDSKHITKTKKVKNYLKKCKNTASAFIQNDYENKIPKRQSISVTSWYVTDEVVVDGISENRVVETHLRDEANSSVETKVSSNNVEKIICPVLKPQVVDPSLQEDAENLTTDIQEKSELEELVDSYIGQYYLNYETTRGILIRQARDVLVCTYNCNIQKFLNEFCEPVSYLLAEIYEEARIKIGNGVSCRGWPLSYGFNGILLHVTKLDKCILRNGDCYLSIKIDENTNKANITINFNNNDCIFSKIINNNHYRSVIEIITMMDNESNNHTSTTADTIELSTMLQNLIVTVDLAIERIPLQDVTFPCHPCSIISTKKDRKCDCSAIFIDKNDACNNIFDSDCSFPHIDSDDDYDCKSVDKNKFDVDKKCVTRNYTQPTYITDLPDKLLLSGIYLPGVSDKMGRWLVMYDADSVVRSEINEADVSRVILYYSSIASRTNGMDCALSILVISPSKLEEIEFLDKSLSLLTPIIKIDCVIVAWKKHDHHRIRHFKHNQTRSSVLPNSNIQYRVVTESDTLEEYIDSNEIPVECGGQCTHHQSEWIHFYKDVEPFIMRCHTCGRRLVNVMLEIKNTNINAQTRKQLHYQQKIISRLLSDPDILRLQNDGQTILTTIEDRAQWLPNSKDVTVSVERCNRILTEVQRAFKRLEQLLEKRKTKLRELLRLKALEDETNEVISWLTQNGEDELKQHSDLASNLSAIKKQEQNFEKFYFISMRNLDKAGDLLEEAGQCVTGGTSLKDLARSLKQHLRGFSDRLEDTRERLEDTSRCFYLLDRAYEWALEAMNYLSRVKPADSQNPGQSVKQLRQYLMAHPPIATDHFSEMIHLAQKLQNEKVLEQCKIAQSRCEETLENIRCIIGYELPNWAASTPLAGRRRSLPATNQSCSNNNNNSTSTCVCWHSVESSQLENITEECYCRPSNNNNSNNNNTNNNNNVLQRSCTWQYPTEHFDDDDKLSSSADNTTEGSETGTKSSSDDIDDGQENERKTPIPPVMVNSHLHRNDSLHLDTNCGPQTLKKQKTAKLIMREMIQTERDYVKALEYVIENYIPELVREDIPQALRGQRNVIFGNIEKIYEFHSQNFLRELECCEHSPFSVGQSFLKHEKKFYLYALYNKNKPKSDSLMSEYGSSFFKRKQISLQDKMDLASYLLKPVQRMGKYALLLQQLMKVAKSDLTELQEAEGMVKFQLRHGNDLLAMDSLRECDVNLKEQGRLLRQNEFLVWQGKGKGKKCLRHVFLFEELILFSKARRFPDRKNLDLYIYKNSIKTSDIGMTAKVGDSNTKFEIWYRKRKPNDTFTFQSMSEDIKQVWTDELSNLLWKQAVRNREMRMAEMSSMGIGNKPCLDIRPSADQINDRSISIAQLCKTVPRFRNSIAVSTMDSLRKRPHSVISVSSSGSSGSSSAGSSTSSSGDNRQTSQCSSAESGIVPDWRNASVTTSANSSVTSESNTISHHLSLKL